MALWLFDGWSTFSFILPEDSLALHPHRKQVLVRYMEEISEIASIKMDS